MIYLLGMSRILECFPFGLYCFLEYFVLIVSVGLFRVSPIALINHEAIAALEAHLNLKFDFF